MTLDDALGRATVPVPAWGRLAYGLGRSASYAAASRGEIEVVRVGHKLAVPVAREARKLGLQHRTEARSAA